MRPSSRLKRYYAARIDDGSMVVVEQDPAELRQLVEDTGSTKSVLKNIAIGQHGFMFAVSAQDCLVEYHPNDLLVGTDAIDGGIDVADLEDGAYAWMVLAGENLYGHVSKIGDTYYIAAVPESDMAATRNVTVGVILFIFFAVMAVVIMYGIFVMPSPAARRHPRTEAGRLPHALRRGVRAGKPLGSAEPVFAPLTFLESFK